MTERDTKRVLAKRPTERSDEAIQRNGPDALPAPRDQQPRVNARSGLKGARVSNRGAVSIRSGSGTFVNRSAGLSEVRR